MKRTIRRAKGRKPARGKTAAPRRPRNRKFDAAADPVDARDWLYRPGLAALPDQVVNIDLTPKVLDQGESGACTGFALAAVINLLLNRRGIRRIVSPAMLYENARRHDEFPGIDYDGSSARGAIKGWTHHGVCAEALWPQDIEPPRPPPPALVEDGLRTPAGAYYRVAHQRLGHVHAALHDAGALYLTIKLHRGWDALEPERIADACPEMVDLSYRRGRRERRLSLPVIAPGEATDRTHCIAVVGYLREGLIVQDSGGPDFGQGGFALLPYDDFLAHAVDLWALQLGVPVRRGV